MTEEVNTRGWPEEGLEHLASCPICRSDVRRCLYQGLRDHIFNAPGCWRLYLCEQCGTAYLNPRPNTKTIHLAYEKYYTHHTQLDDEPQQAGNDWRSSLKQLILRSYIRTRFGKFSPTLTDGWAIAMYLRPWLRRRFDGAMRHLPRSVPDTKTVLDVGCGNGRFLSWARTAGWKGVGTEFDPTAARIARARGFEVHEKPLEYLVEAGRTFDAITISHVVEHVHDVRSFLVAARRLLKPQGFFWIETPNIQAYGHQIFGAGWRGLHPPQHLQIFSRNALEAHMRQAGFVDIRSLPWQPNWRAMAELSFQGPVYEGAKRQRLRLGCLNELVAYRDSSQSEFITLAATTQAD